MATKSKYPFRKSLKNEFGGVRFYIGKGFDFTHGKGIFCQVYDSETFHVGNGFHKTNKFTAVREALKDMQTYQRNRL